MRLTGWGAEKNLPGRAGPETQTGTAVARCPSFDGSENYGRRAAQPSALTREARRDILRAAVFLWKTPLLTPRISSGCATRNALAAASLSPEAIASSTLRI